VLHPEARMVPKGLNLMVVIGAGASRQTSMVSGRPVRRRISVREKENERGVRVVGDQKAEHDQVPKNRGEMADGRYYSSINIWYYDRIETYL